MIREVKMKFSKYHALGNDYIVGRLLGYRDSIYAADLLVCAVAHLDFFTFLKKGPKSFDEICEKLNIRPRPADVLLSLLRSLDLIRKHGDKYGLTGLSGKFLARGAPESLAPYYASLKERPQCREFFEILRTGRPAGWSSRKGGDDWATRMQDPAFAGSFTLAMDSRGAFLGRRLAQKLKPGRHASLLDVAGGSGAYACAVARRYPRIAAAVFEKPPVDRAAARSIESKGMTSMVRVIAGDMFEGLPEGFDVHLFANTLHDWDRDAVEKLAGNSFRSMEPGGTIAVFDAHLNERKDGPRSVAEYSCLLMHSTEGRCYSTREIGDMLKSAGFTRIKTADVAADRTLITGRKF
jgi:hypothetical protein